jgi:uncharacterized protein (TIGR03382 family)
MMRVLAIALVLAVPTIARADVNYRFPGSDAHRQFFYVTAYRDLTGSGGGLQDWGCGTKTYDGHRGTDLGVGGFAGMDAGRDVVAAAAGTVTYVNDGAFDRCTTADCAGGGGFGNYVRIQHADGKVTYYGHLKKFSLTVALGDTVTCGQKLGEVGSSGYSTGPHLHFEPRVSEVSDDPFSGPCGGSTSWWVSQGDYLSLPATTCEDAPPAHALLSLSGTLDAIDGQAPDAHPDGDSAGVFDLESGQTVTARLSVTNAASAQVGREIVVGIDAPGGFLTVVDWEVFDDFAGNACGGDWCPNDANDSPDNPPRQAPGESFELALNAMSPGETKMIVLTLGHATPTDGAAPHAPVRLWVKNVEGAYSKASFDATPDNVDDFQTFNGGDLTQVVVLDTWGVPADPPGDGDPPGDRPPDDGTDAGGCSTHPAPPPLAFAAVLVCGLLVRRRRLRTRRSS